MVTLNGGTDLYLLIIPMPMLWAARMPLRRKLALTAVFSGGIFVTMAGVWRCVLILKVRTIEIHCTPANLKLELTTS